MDEDVRRGHTQSGAGVVMGEVLGVFGVFGVFGVLRVTADYVIKFLAIGVLPSNRKPSSAMAWLILILILGSATSTTPCG